MSKPTEFVRCNSCNNAYHCNSHNGICIKSIGKCEHCSQEEAEPSKPTAKKDRLKKLSEPAQRTLDEYVDSLPAHEKQPVIDDTFNDDTPAQTFSVLEKMRGIICLNCGLDYQLYHNRVSIERDGMCRQCFEKHKAGKAIPFASCDFGTDDKTVTCDFFSLSDDTPMRLIGIAGPARAGKDTLASYLLEHLTDDWSRSSFADPIKKMLEVIGVDCSDEAKAVIDERFCYTPRHMMQILGTEWGREMIHGNIWVEAFARMNAGKQVVVPDVRFENEADLVRANGILIHLVGRGGIEGDHVSENKLPFKEGDIVIDNSRGIDWLYAQVKSHRRLLEVVFE